MPVTFLARTRDKAEGGRAGAAAAVRSAAITKLIAVGTYDEDLPAAVRDADLIFEALAEDFSIKQPMFEQIDRYRKPDAIVATVSSGLSITELANGLSESFQRHFLGLHFFNPPQVIDGTEIIPGENTDSEVVDFIDAFATKRLGRLTVRTANTAGFAGNRIGFKVLNEVAQLSETHGPLLMDRLIGPYTGRALPPLATIDLVGWDVHRAIVDNVCAKLQDEAIDTYRLPEFMRRLIDQGVLGNKSGGGFFRVDDNRKRFVLDVGSGNYVPASEIALPPLGFADEMVSLHRIGEYRRAMQLLVQAEGDKARLARKVVAGYISYAFCRVGEVTDSIAGIDRIMAAGFNWAPPSVLVDLIGLAQAVEMIDEAQLEVPELLREALDRAPDSTFFDDPRLSSGRYFVAK